MKSHFVPSIVAYSNEPRLPLRTKALNLSPQIERVQLRAPTAVHFIESRNCQSLFVDVFFDESQ